MKTTWDQIKNGDPGLLCGAGGAERAIATGVTGLANTVCVACAPCHPGPCFPKAPRTSVPEGGMSGLENFK